MKNLLFSAATLLFSAVSEKSRFKDDKTDVILSTYTSIYAESSEVWRIVTCWVDTNGEKQVLQTLKKHKHLVTILNGKQLFIHGFSASYHTVKKHHNRVRTQIIKQMRYILSTA